MTLSKILVELLEENTIKVVNYTQTSFDEDEQNDVQIIKKLFKKLFLNKIKKSQLNGSRSISLLDELKMQADEYTRSISHYNIDVQGSLYNNPGYYLTLFIKQLPVMTIIGSLPKTGKIDPTYKHTFKY